MTNINDECVCVCMWASELIVSVQLIFSLVIIFSLLKQEQKERLRECFTATDTRCCCCLVYSDNCQELKLVESIALRKTKHQLLLSGSDSTSLVCKHWCEIPGARKSIDSLCSHLPFLLGLCFLDLLLDVIWQLKSIWQINIRRGTVRLKAKTKHCNIQWVTSNNVCSLQKWSSHLWIYW